MDCHYLILLLWIKMFEKGLCGEVGGGEVLLGLWCQGTIYTLNALGVDQTPSVPPVMSLHKGDKNWWICHLFLMYLVFVSFSFEILKPFIYWECWGWKREVTRHEKLSELKTSTNESQLQSLKMNFPGRLGKGRLKNIVISVTTACKLGH